MYFCSKVTYVCFKVKFSKIDSLKRRCNFSRNQLKYASFEDSELAEDFGISTCAREETGECCRDNEMCRCNGQILDIFPPQCSIEPTYCEAKGNYIFKN